MGVLAFQEAQGTGRRAACVSRLSMARGLCWRSLAVEGKREGVANDEGGRWPEKLGVDCVAAGLRKASFHVSSSSYRQAVVDRQGVT